MKVRSYQSVVEKNIVDVKRYLLQISEGYWLQDIHDIVNSSFEIKSIKKKINKNDINKRLLKFINNPHQL